LRGLKKIGCGRIITSKSVLSGVILVGFPGQLTEKPASLETIKPVAPLSPTKPVVRMAGFLRGLNTQLSLGDECQPKLDYKIMLVLSYIEGGLQLNKRGRQRRYETGRLYGPTYEKQLLETSFSRFLCSRECTAQGEPLIIYLIPSA
jgi:hypothetical protein